MHSTEAFALIMKTEMVNPEIFTIDSPKPSLLRVISDLTVQKFEHKS